MCSGKIHQFSARRRGRVHDFLTGFGPAAVRGLTDWELLCATLWEQEQGETTYHEPISLLD
jgi:hypothetical protein